MDHVHGTHEFIAVTTLLGSDEKRQLGMFFARPPNQLVFLQSKRQRLLYKYILPRFQCFHCDFDVPMVRRNNADRVDVFSVQHFSVVAVCISLPCTNPLVILGTQSMSFVHITDSDNVAEVRVAASVSRPTGPPS